MGDAFPVLRGGTEGDMWAEEQWVKLSASERVVGQMASESTSKGTGLVELHIRLSLKSRDLMTCLQNSGGTRWPKRP